MYLSLKRGGLFLFKLFPVRNSTFGGLTIKTISYINLSPNRTYHLYNRSNNSETLFKTEENYRYFLRKFDYRFKDSLKVFAYCLMPTHFHFLVQVKTDQIVKLKINIGVHLSSYTKAINKAFGRTGSLFQQHTKAKMIKEEEYLITLLTYIHQNPIRSGLVKDLKSWPYSSYLDLAGYRNSRFVDSSLINQYFPTVKEFQNFSEKTIKLGKG